MSTQTLEKGRTEEKSQFSDFCEESYIVGVFGNRGAGKTLTSVALIREYARLGWNVHSNISLDFEYEPLDITKFILDPQSFRNSVLFIDELHNYAAARKSMSAFNQVFSRFLLQIRHLNDVFIYTTMRGRLVDWIVEDQSDIVLNCRWLGVKGIPQRTDRVGVTCLNRTRNPPDMTHWQFRAKPFFGFYSTHELVDLMANESFSELAKVIRKQEKERFEKKLEDLNKNL